MWYLSLEGKIMTKKQFVQLNQYQINLIKDWLEAEQDNLHDQSNKWGAGVPDYDKAHLEKYGTTSYEEAQRLIEDIRNQLTSEPEEPKDNPCDKAVIVGWVKNCEGQLLRIGYVVCDISHIEFIAQDTYTIGGNEYDGVSLKIPGVLNPWSSLDDCIRDDYSPYDRKSTYFFTGAVAQKLRDLFSVT
jgi:hypothetical protein